MTRRLFLVLLIMSLFGTGFIHAQTSGGQICVRAFEDRNANGEDDTSEPRIQRNLSATLADAEGIISASAFMEDSSNAAAGVLCFQRLAAGQYTLRVTSADYNFTTENEFFTAITDTGIQTFSVGGQQVVVAAPVVEGGGPDFQITAAERQSLITRLIFAGIGAAVVIGAMAIVGAIIYLLFLRRPPQPKYATGQYPAVRTATGQYPAVEQSPPSTGSVQPVIMPATDSTDVPLNPAPKTPPSVPRVEYEDDDTNRPEAPRNSGDDDFEFTDDE